jgi:hypothetical protein
MRKENYNFSNQPLREVPVPVILKRKLSVSFAQRNNPEFSERNLSFSSSEVADTTFSFLAPVLPFQRVKLNPVVVVLITLNPCLFINLLNVFAV